MESPTDNVLQGSVRARSGSPARRRNTGAQGKDTLINSRLHIVGLTPTEIVSSPLQ